MDGNLIPVHNQFIIYKTTFVAPENLHSTETLSTCRAVFSTQIPKFLDDDGRSLDIHNYRGGTEENISDILQKAVLTRGPQVSVEYSSHIRSVS